MHATRPSGSAGGRAVFSDRLHAAAPTRIGMRPTCAARIDGAQRRRAAPLLGNALATACGHTDTLGATETDDSG